MTKLMEEEIQPILVPAVLEHEGIASISGGEKPRSRLTSGGDNNLDSPAHVDPKEALDKLLRVLTFFHSTLIKHGLDPEIISQIFKQASLKTQKYDCRWRLLQR